MTYEKTNLNYESVTKTNIEALQLAIKKIDALREPVLALVNADKDPTTHAEVVERWAVSELAVALNIGRRHLVEYLDREQGRRSIGQQNGREGGKTRAANLSPTRRKKIARKAARARWNKTAEVPKVVR